MGRDDDIVGTETSGRDDDTAGGTSKPEAGDVQFNAYGETTPGDDPGVSQEDAESSQLTDEYDETPEDLQLGKRRAVGQDPDSGAGEEGGAGEPGGPVGSDA